LGHVIEFDPLTAELQQGRRRNPPPHFAAPTFIKNKFPITEQFTLALGLQSFQSQLGGSQWNLLMAAAVLVIVPVLLLFFLAQKTFIKGISTTGIKG